MAKYQIKYDKNARALYIEIEKNKVTKTIERGSNVYIDFDKNNQVVGIEMLDVNETPNPQELILNLPELQKVSS